MLAKIANNFQHFAARRKWVVKLMVKLRNQANKVIAYALAEDHLPEKNGEEHIMAKLAPALTTVFDIGANKGEWTELFLSKKASNNYLLTLVEPGNEALNILTNKFGHNKQIRILGKGLSDKQASELFYEEFGAGEQSGFCITPYHCNFLTRDVAVDRLDNICEKDGIVAVDYVKIDCEGYDAFVIRGAERLLKEKAIKFLQFEYGTGWKVAGATLTSTIIFLNNLDYEVKLITHTGLRNYNAGYFGEFFGYSNFLAFPKSMNVEAFGLKIEN